jgi:acyl carrier protein phosphodiesterase
MNFLAHLYLSGENKDLKLGNFIGDYIKGNKYLDFPEGIQKGILLHRRIDSFTDNHTIIKQASIPFKPEYGRYSGIIVDVVFDHFLALNWNDYSAYTLKDFTREIHSILLSNFRILPLRVKKFLPFLIQSRRLESYSFEHGIKKALEIMSHYTSLPEKSDFAMKILQQNNFALLENFRLFIGEIIEYVELEFSIEIKKPFV